MPTEIAFLSHCVPNPPDKGEKIRAFHELSRLAERYRVHLACFARSEKEIDDAHKLRDRCASVYVERLQYKPALVRAGLKFMAGGCLNRFFYDSAKLKTYIAELTARNPVKAILAYSVVMAPYVPAGIPWLLDMIDVDSEKWFQYAKTRRPGFLYSLEANRLRGMELRFARRAGKTYLSTRPEEELLRSFVQGAETGTLENGVDFEFFDPAACSGSRELGNRRFVVFTATLDYFPNIEAACWFARDVWPLLRQRDPALELFLVGRNPAAGVLQLARQPGIVVTGAVPDVRPYRKHALAEVAPLRIARGMQNKVLEALAMGKPALISPAVAATFGDALPYGVIRCEAERDYVAGLFDQVPLLDAAQIRAAARVRFSWARNLDILLRDLDALTAGSAAAVS